MVTNFSKRNKKQRKPTKPQQEKNIEDRLWLPNVKLMYTLINCFIVIIKMLYIYYTYQAGEMAAFLNGYVEININKNI